MCWACYTPLTGAAPAASPSARATKDKDNPDKKSIPPWQMGVIGVALVIGIGMGIKTLLPSETYTGGDTSPPPIRPRGGRTDTPAPQPAPPTTGQVFQGELPKPPPVVPNQPLMRVAVPPNPRIDVATMGIVPTEQNINEYKAASLAVLAHRHMVNAKRWRRIQIFVFSDQQSATMFRDYQKKRRGAPLETQDYKLLTELWQRTPAAYEFHGQYERWISPSKYPSDWWERWGDFLPRST